MSIDLSIVIPCYNEGQNLKLLLESCRNAIGERDDIEVIIVDNGSTDLSLINLEIILKDRKYSFVNLKKVKKNIGYGHGILEGLSVAKGKVLSWTHADLQTDPLDVILAFEKYKVDLINSICIVKGNRIGRNFFDTIFTAGMSILSSIFLRSILWDINAQPKIFNKNLMLLLDKAPLDFSLDLYLLYMVNKSKIRINSYPVKFSNRKFGQAKGGGTLSGKIKLIKRTLKYIIELRKNVLNEK